jgi:hypothetical protein
MRHDRNSSSSRRRAPMKWLRRGALVGGLLAVTATISACGGSDDPTILNTEKVERAIEASSLAQRHKRVHVSCPAGVHQKKGLVFNCTTLSTGRKTRFVVTELDDAGRVHYEAP